jgi:hypothetical protein
VRHTTGYRVQPIKVSARIPAPPEELLRFIADTRNDPLWCPNVDTADLVDGDSVDVGSRFRFHQHLDRPGGKHIEFDVDVEIVQLDDRSVKWLVSDRFQDRKIEITVEPQGEGSRITQVTQASFHKSPGLAKWIYPLLARRTLKDQFRHLAAHFE